MRNNLRFLSILGLYLLCAADSAFAQEGAHGGAGGLAAVGAGLAVGIAALGGGLGQGKAVSAALDSIGRNPSAAGKLLVPMVLGLVFVETLVILSFVIALGLSGKV